MAILLSQLFAFLSIALVMVAATDVCDICSCFPYEEDFVISCKNYRNHVLEVDFEDLEWPKIEENRHFKVFINNFPINLLPKISGDSNVISLNLDDNNIRTIASNPFEFFTNLDKLSVANNKITDLTKDFLKSQRKLTQLNLSNNTLATIDPSVLAHLTQLQEINLSHNFLTKITADFLEATSHVEVIRLENNKIYAIDTAYDKGTHKLRKLLLASNQFTLLTSSMFEKLTSLEVIDLSDNKISNVDEDAFTQLTNLKLIDLSSNNIKRVQMKLPNSLELLSINSNYLNSWPLVNIPENLTELEVRQNHLDFIFPNDKFVPNLVRLDASRNLIHQLPETQFIKLEYLDLGYNLLGSIPQGINEKVPFLKELILDGNEISSIEFVESTTVGSISLCNLTQLTKIGPYAFTNLSGTFMTFDKSETCVNVKISENENLAEIDKDAFYGVRLCFLDLSYNNLSAVPRNLTNWKKVENGVNLQGNKFACSCENEWMIDEIIKVLYENSDHQDLLLDFRCQSRNESKGKRFVHFLNHEHPFCRNESDDDEEILEAGIVRFLPKNLLAPNEEQSGRKIEFHLTPWSPGFLIIVGLCSIILVLIVIVGVKWQRDQNLKLARRNRLYYDDYY